MWPPNNPALNPVTMQQRDYHTDIHSVSELKQWLIEFWCNPDQGVINIAIDWWCHAKGGHFKHTIWTPYSDYTWLVLCEWLAQILYTFLQKYIRNVYIYCTTFVRSAAMQLREGGRFYSRYVHWSLLTVTVKELSKSVNRN